MRKITKGLRLPQGAGSLVLKVEVDLENRIFYFYLSGNLIHEERFWDPVPEMTMLERMEEAEKSLEGSREGAELARSQAETWKRRTKSHEKYLQFKELEDSYDKWFWDEYEYMGIDFTQTQTNQD